MLVRHEWLSWIYWYIWQKSSISLPEFGGTKYSGERDTITFHHATAYSGSPCFSTSCIQRAGQPVYHLTLSVKDHNALSMICHIIFQIQLRLFTSVFSQSSVFSLLQTFYFLLQLLKFNKWVTIGLVLIKRNEQQQKPCLHCSSDPEATAEEEHRDIYTQMV